MKRKKIITSILCATLLFGTVLGIGVNAGFGSGIAVVASETKIIKSGIFGQKIVFSDLDFKQGLAITDFDKIEIKSIPLSTEGTLLLAGRRVKEGTVIKRKNIGALVFIPASKTVNECKFTFTTEDFAEGAPIDFVIKFTDKVNYAPTIDYAISTGLDTQREISVYGQMSATDGEGDEIEYIVVGYPKYGVLNVIDSYSGEYSYTPPQEYTGSDSFSYVARDEWGNFSKLCKVKIEVGERMCEIVYKDMEDTPEYNAAVALTAMGIMDGKTLGDGAYFMPDSKLTKAEFLTMAMKAAGLKGNNSTSPTYFDDNDDIPGPLLPYVKTAQSMGIINGEFKSGKLLFNPNDNITKCEAALIIAKLVEIEDSSSVISFSDKETVPVWARDEISALCDKRIISCEGDVINGNAELTKAEAAQYLYNMLKYI